MEEVVTIDCKRVVSWFKHEDPQFTELYRRMQTSFADENYGYRVCLHEAAHAVFMELDGIKNVRFTGPEIIYDRTIDRCVGAGGRATGDDQPEVEITDEYIFKRTMQMAAGGVALRMLGERKGKPRGRAVITETLKDCIARILRQTMNRWKPFGNVRKKQ